MLLAAISVVVNQFKVEDASKAVSDYCRQTQTYGER